MPNDQGPRASLVIHDLFLRHCVLCHLLIGALLEDGLGDTIRVSLTEEPEFEIPVAEELVKRYDSRSKHDAIEDISESH